MKLFITGFLQVFFVAINTYFLANTFIVGVFLASFSISFIWSFNIKKVAFGTMRDRLIYSFGASFGAVAGLYLSKFILKML